MLRKLEIDLGRDPIPEAETEPRLVGNRKGRSHRTAASVGRRNLGGAETGSDLHLAKRKSGFGRSKVCNSLTSLLIDLAHFN